jgi:hypothetical protein
MCLPSRYPAMDVCSGSTTPAFRRRITIWSAINSCGKLDMSSKNHCGLLGGMTSVIVRERSYVENGRFWAYNVCFSSSARLRFKIICALKLCSETHVESPLLFSDFNQSSCRSTKFPISNIMKFRSAVHQFYIRTENRRTDMPKLIAVLSRVSVTKDGVRIGIWIYWPLTGLNNN